MEIVVTLFILEIQIGRAFRGRFIGRRGIRATTEAEKGARVVVVVVVVAVHDRLTGVGIIGIHHHAAALGLQAVVEIEEIASRRLLGSGWMWILL